MTAEKILPAVPGPFRQRGIRISLLILLITFSATAPFSLRAQYMEVGLFVGDSYYIGDLNPSMPFRNLQVAYGAIARYNLDTRWTVKLGISRGTVKGNGSNPGLVTGRELSFESPITDISATVEFNFLRYFTGSRGEVISPYLYGGIGVFFFDPQAGSVSLRSLGTEGQNVGYDGREPYSTVQVNVPFGIGVKFSLSKRFCLSAFWEMHKTFTDYLDDISTTYYLDGDNINPDIASEYYSDPAMNHQPGMQRGNSHTKDWYSFSGVALTYKFDLRNKRKCKDTPHN